MAACRHRPVVTPLLRLTRRGLAPWEEQRVECGGAGRAQAVAACLGVRGATCHHPVRFSSYP